MFWNFMTCEATRLSKRPINTMVCQVSHHCKSLQKKFSKKILTQTNPPQTHLSPSLSHGKHQDPHPLSHSICLRNPLKISSRVLRLGREIASDSGVEISQTETVNNGEARRTRVRLWREGLINERWVLPWSLAKRFIIVVLSLSQSLVRRFVARASVLFLSLVVRCRVQTRMLSMHSYMYSYMVHMSTS